MARALFSSEGAPCLKCHATGDPAHDATATAPNFTLRQRAVEAGLDQALDAGSGDDRVREPRCPPGCSRATATVGIRGSGAGRASTNYPKDHADLLVRVHVPVHAGRAGPPALVGPRRSRIRQISSESREA